MPSVYAELRDVWALRRSGSLVWRTITGVQSGPGSGTGSQPAPTIRQRISRLAKQNRSRAVSAANALPDRRWLRFDATRLDRAEGLQRADEIIPDADPERSS